MNRIVRENYPVSKLPEELRSELQGVQEVRVVIEVRDEAAIDEHPFSRLRHRARDTFKSQDEVVAHVRTLRDEWDERDRFHERLRSGS